MGIESRRIRIGGPAYAADSGDTFGIGAAVVEKQLIVEFDVVAKKISRHIISNAGPDRCLTGAAFEVEDRKLGGFALK